MRVQVLRRLCLRHRRPQRRRFPPAFERPARPALRSALIPAPSMMTAQPGPRRWRAVGTEAASAPPPERMPRNEPRHDARHDGRNELELMAVRTHDMTDGEDATHTQIAATAASARSQRNAKMDGADADVSAAPTNRTRRRTPPPIERAPQTPITPEGSITGWLDVAREGGFIRLSATANCPNRPTRSFRRH